MTKSYDSIAQRLMQILLKLNNGESVSVPELAEEFAVSERTIQKDLNKRLAPLPIEKKNKRYQLSDEHYLGGLKFKDLKKFAVISSIEKLYPILDENMLFDIFNKNVNDTLKINGHHYEDIQGKRNLFDQIGAAITKHNILYFTYKETRRTVYPYKLINTNGIWYLLAVEDDTLKHFSFNKLTEVEFTQQPFIPERDVISILEDEDSTWFTKEQIEIELFVNNEVVEYFQRRPLLPHQKVLKTCKEGLVISTKVAYEEEILRIVRYWIPHIRILSPLELQERLKRELEDYLPYC